jgi:hypothetical protein
LAAALTDNRLSEASPLPPQFQLDLGHFVDAGLGTCWIGFAQTWLGTAEGKALLKLPAAYRPVAPIIVGHPKAAPPAVARKEPEIRWVNA